jgi:hypothetical protein
VGPCSGIPERLTSTGNGVVTRENIYNDCQQRPGIQDACNLPNEAISVTRSPEG